MQPRQSPWLHNEVARRMAQRLQWVLKKPQSWVHWEPLLGGDEAQRLIFQAYPLSDCQVRVAHSQSLKDFKSRWGTPWRQLLNIWLSRVGLPVLRRCVTLSESLAPASVQMLWANMCLHYSSEPVDLIKSWHEALKDGGFLMFSCLGPDTLKELRAIYQQQEWPPPAHEFTDMHDWGDMLVHAGFAEPVMDMERIQLAFESPDRLLRELRGLGRNFHRHRFGTCRGRQWLRKMHQALSDYFVSGAPLTLTFEIIYGHAFKPEPRVKLTPVTQVPLGQFKGMLHRNNFGARYGEFN
jgi:malonyl-CoA O-methyltransferase